MTANSTNRDSRDWTLIIFLLPIGILLMVLAGQFAIRLVPSWSVEGGMGSSLDPETASGGQSGLVAPISFDILTPMAWLDTFLTPGPDSANEGVFFAPFVVFEPSATPSPIASPSLSNTPATPGATPTGTTTPGGTATSTKKPPADGGGTSTPAPAVCADSTANNVGSPLPCTYTPVTSTPVGAQVSVPGNTNIGAPDGLIGNVQDGRYVVLTLGTPITVNGPSDTNYDFVYYERANPVNIAMDSVILSISSDGTTYYIVFNWGDNIPDNNSNVGIIASNTGTEDDNQTIQSTDLYGTPPNQTGILIDVDNAPSHPPVGSYGYLAIQAPIAPTNDGNDGADIDSIQVTEVAP